MDILFLFGVFGIFFHSLCKCNLLFLRHYVSFFTARISVLVSFHYYYFLFIAKILFPAVFPLRFPLSLQFLFWYSVTLLYFFLLLLLFFGISLFLYCLLSLIEITFSFWNLFFFEIVKSPFSLALSLEI